MEKGGTNFCVSLFGRGLKDFCGGFLFHGMQTFPFVYDYWLQNTV